MMSVLAAIFNSLRRKVEHWACAKRVPRVTGAPLQPGYCNVGFDAVGANISPQPNKHDRLLGRSYLKGEFGD